MKLIYQMMTQLNTIGKKIQYALWQASVAVFFLVLAIIKGLWKFLMLFQTQIKKAKRVFSTDYNS